MGLFWGNDDVKTKQPQVQKPEETDPRFKPLYVLSQGGGAAAGKEFGYIIRDIQQAAGYNNGLLSDMYDMMKQLLKENEEMRNRLESLEKQVQQNVNPPLERAI